MSDKFATIINGTRIIPFSPGDVVTPRTGYLNFPYAHRVRYPYSLESFEISNETSVNVLTVTIVDQTTYEHDTRTLMVFYE